MGFIAWIVKTLLRSALLIAIVVGLIYFLGDMKYIEPNSLVASDGREISISIPENMCGIGEMGTKVISGTEYKPNKFVVLFDKCKIIELSTDNGTDVIAGTLEVYTQNEFNQVKHGTDLLYTECKKRSSLYNLKLHKISGGGDICAAAAGERTVLIAFRNLGNHFVVFKANVPNENAGATKQKIEQLVGSYNYK